MTNGCQSIAVWTMQCIDYDANFQLNLLEKFPDFEPPPKEKSAGKGKKPTAANKVRSSRAGGKKTGEKRKWDEVSEDEVESSADNGDNDDSEEESLENEVELVYRSYGTRSRPINIL